MRTLYYLTILTKAPINYTPEVGFIGPHDDSIVASRIIPYLHHVLCTKVSNLHHLRHLTQSCAYHVPIFTCTRCRVDIYVKRICSLHYQQKCGEKQWFDDQHNT